LEATTHNTLECTQRVQTSAAKSSIIQNISTFTCDRDDIKCSEKDTE